MKIKNTILLLVLCSFFISCSDKKEENKENQKIVQKPGKIEIVQNENAYNKKVNISNDIKDRSYYYSYNKNNEEKNKRTKLDAHVRVKSPYESVQISLFWNIISAIYSEAYNFSLIIMFHKKYNPVLHRLTSVLKIF